LTLIDSRLHIFEAFNNQIFTISQVGNKSKPDPAVFLFAAEKMQSKPAECFVIEDAPRGIEAAKNAGMFCIALTTTFTKDRLTQADIIVDSFKELKLNTIL
ncbi:MAG TPA: HAD family phosphatase, partial [Candidatus Limnocylindria bacterium]|nr:HAD family phosphatase [Candidatus Limnocylindria bacterium]